MTGARSPLGLSRLSSLQLILVVALLLSSVSASAAEPADIERDLVISIDGRSQTVGLEEALSLLKVPAVSLALIDQDRIALARAFGDGVTTDTLFQAASLSKFVTAVGAVRLVAAKRLSIDDDVDSALTSWRIPANRFDENDPVTLRGLLSMTGGIGVPGFAGYAVKAKLPTLVQILDGVPPANSPPVTVIDVPGSAYRYSGGGYEIAEALVTDVAGAPFTEVMDDLVLVPAAMTRSTFAQPLPPRLEDQAATGHYGDGQEIPGRWHVVPEHAAGGLWSTASDLANLLILTGRAWRGESHPFLSPEMAREMYTRQNGGPYGLGAAVEDKDGSPVVMKRGQNVGYQSYMVFLPGRGQGLVVMTNSDNGSQLAEALMRRAAALYNWSLPPVLPD